MDAMLDFVKIKTSTKEPGRKSGQPTITIFPEFQVGPSEDLMIRGRSFYAIWDERIGMWSRDPGAVQEMVDADILSKRDEYPEDVNIELKLMKNFSTKKWSEFLDYCHSLPDNYHELDSSVTFQNVEVKKADYISKKLPYSIKPGDAPAYSELMSELYDPIELEKLEWAIGSIFCGASKKIQKFIVLYGAAGTGKSTFLNILQMLFEGYYNVFEAKELTSSTNSFALSSFKDNPLVSIQHDGDLSRIEDNTRLNSLVSHEEVVVNVKYQAPYVTRHNTFLFMGTNKPVKITDAKSGIVRRLIDVRPSGRTVPFERYRILMAQIGFELPAIASHCLDVYSKLGPDAYDDYRPIDMMGATNDFFNFVEDFYDTFKAATDEGVPLAQAWTMYKKWCDDTAVKYPLSRRSMKEEMKNYFSEFRDRFRDESGNYKRCVYFGFLTDKFQYIPKERKSAPPMAMSALRLDHRASILDKLLADCPAQLATTDGIPSMRWSSVKTVLSDIDTSELHYVKVPENHIVIDFDIKDENGNKDLERNLSAASKWPDTYAELSQGGHGVHLHYIYDGDVSRLSRVYDKDIEVKVFKGNSALRRRLTRCNDIPVAVLSSGLPEKKGGKDKVINFEGLKNEKALRTLIEKNLRKEIHPGTKPSVDFISKILDEAYDSGMPYDVTDLRPAIAAFANNSTHHALYCVKAVNKMKFHSERPSNEIALDGGPIVFYDVEVFPNLFVVVWKAENGNPVKMINPGPADLEPLLKLKLVGFNCRRYDNHILYGRMLGYTNSELYALSQKIISGSANAMFREAYGISYTDIFDFSSLKQSLKKFEIDLGIHHQELGLPWDQPVPESMWEKVAEYCVNDVVATEATFKARYDDFVAREILSELSGLTVNDPTRAHMTKIIFGNDKNPQSQFVYTDLSEIFPGYKYEAGVSEYRGENPGEGGYVYAEPGMYKDVALLDVASMHPNSLINLNLFGDTYTKRFKDLLDARILIKHGDHINAKKLLDGKLAKFLDDPKISDKSLSYSLKIAINSVYGYTKANFDCEFKDPRNVDNIVAKRGALFMIDLRHAVEDLGYNVAHIKTDSIKIPGADKAIIDDVMDYGKRYGYTFEHEATYSKMCLVNNAVYIAKKDDGGWTATGAQFAVPYVFKTLFSHDEIKFEDLCESRSVTGTSSMYLDMNEDLPEGEHNYVFVGKAGLFCPMLPGSGGGLLMREKDGKYYAVTGTKGYRWLESETVKTLGKESEIDTSYYEQLAEKAVESISEFGSFDDFVKEN